MSSNDFINVWLVLMSLGVSQYFGLLLLSGVSYFRYKIRNSKNALAVSFLSLCYISQGCLLVFWSNPGYVKISAVLWAFIGTLNFLFYYRLVKGHLNYKLTKWEGYIDKFLWFFISILASAIVQFIFTDECFLLGSFKVNPEMLIYQYLNGLWVPSFIFELMLGLISLFMLLGSLNLLLLNSFSKTPDLYIFVGISLNIIFSLHDAIAYATDWTYAFALAGFSSLVELYRIIFKNYKSLNKDIVGLQKQLESVSSAVLVSYVAGSISHDLSNHLQKIIIGEDILRRQLKRSSLDNPKIPKYLGQISHSANRIERLSSSYLKLLRGNSHVEKEPVELAEIVMTLKDLYHDNAKQKNIELVWDVPNLKQMLNTNEVLVLQVIMNILNNAMDAIDNLERKIIQVRIKNVDANIVFEISDNGEGIKKEIKDHIFTMGFSTKGNNGNGIGLWTASKFAKKLGGELRLMSSESGACFQFSLPV